MGSNLVRAIRLPPCRVPEPVRDPSILEGYLEDASSGFRGAAAGLLRVASEGEAAAFLRATAGRGVPVLPQAARSSLTGGAVPRGETVVSVEAMSGIGTVEACAGGGVVRVQPGVRLRDLQKALAQLGYYYPPVPTYQEAMVGGTVSTNAGGAASFKYGVTRDWVEGLRVVLWNGDVLALRRGEASAGRGGAFRILLSDSRLVEVPVPGHAIPPLKKMSAGYYAADPLDLVDLFVGSEGTLGLISEVTLRLVPLPAAVLTALAFPGSWEDALALAAILRSEAAAARGDPGRADVRAIEFMDERSLDLLREHGDTRRLRVTVPERARAALLLELELGDAVSAPDALELVGRVLEGRGVPDVPLGRFLGILHDRGVLTDLELALPEDDSRQEALREFREAVPERVNEILSARRRDDPEVRKVGGDLIVPFERLGEMVRIYEDGARRRGLTLAIWGHLSDGNLHPNILPRSAADVASGWDAMLEFGAEAARRGGCPLSEHGVGRSPLKQELLRRFLGEEAVLGMRRIKRALDPEGRFSPGVLFPVA